MKKLLIPAVALAAILAAGPAVAKDPTISFKEDILPIFQIRCQTCHVPGGEGYEKSGFDTRTYDGVMKGTKFGSMIVPGDPFTSNLMVLLDGKAGIQMPHNARRKLTTCDRDMIRTWILEGAQDN